MKVSYIPHAKEQMVERGISSKQVEEAIIKAQKRYIQRNGKVRCVYKNKRKELIVIYRQNKENYKVITAFYPYED